MPRGCKWHEFGSGFSDGAPGTTHYISFSVAKDRAGRFWVKGADSDSGVECLANEGSLIDFVEELGEGFLDGLLHTANGLPGFARVVTLIGAMPREDDSTDTAATAEILRLPVAVRRLFYPETAPEIRVVTRKSLDQTREFAHLRRTRWTDRRLLVYGEWSQSWNHQGTARFDIASTGDRRTWALYEVGFPTRLVAFAAADVGLSSEQAGATLLAEWIRAGGVYLDFEYELGEGLNRELFVKLLNSAMK